MSDNGIGGPISAKHAVRIRIKVCHSRPSIAEKVARSLASITAAIGVPFVLRCDFSPLGIPSYVLIAGQPNFIAMVMGLAATEPNFYDQRK
jgi:hypothetical protein